jgi:hypothetical protein
VGFYPVHSDKSPALGGKLDRVATLDPLKINYWIACCQHRNFAARLLRNSQLVVIDTESPWKHPGRIGPDGEMVLSSLLEDADMSLPPSPLVQTASAGFHRYLLAPTDLPIAPRVSLWPGIDILAAGCSVILPGSRTEAGEYKALRSFGGCDVPELPRGFAELIRKARASVPPSTSKALSSTIPDAGPNAVSRREWWLLFRNHVFRSFWTRSGKFGDSTDSAYEFHLAKACFCCGLNFRQAEAVIMHWRDKHRLDRSLRQLRCGILPKAWSEVEPWVERWRAERERARATKNANKTVNRIRDFALKSGVPQTPSSISAALAIPKERVKKAMQRMAGQGLLIGSSEGYVVPGQPGTF